ncbi:MAG: hypothetical protein HGA44_20570 [Cellulomonadaceae bacterium]|nr:hypothetical protein [Cellulomonadaceae bacterium]
MAGFFAWSMDGSQGVGDRLIGGVVFGTLLLFEYRCAVWPKVVVGAETVVIQNPLVTYEVTGACEIVLSNGQFPTIRTARGSVPVFAFSSSLLAGIGGNQKLHRLVEAVNARTSAATAEPAISRDRRTILRQYLALQLVMAALVLVAGFRH